jgi:hypothetical protein
MLLADRLTGLGVSRVVMEATADYWKPVFYLLEAVGLEVWLVNARDVKHLPGRPKTDKLDAVWLAKVTERQMLRPGFVPPNRSGGCVTLPATALIWSAPAPRRRTGSRNCSKTPASNCPSSSPTCSGCRGGT